MYIFTLVDDVQKVVEQLRESHGDYRLAMLYNTDFAGYTSWNFIVSAPWTDHISVAEATRIIAAALHEGLGAENKAAVSRITVLRPNSPFVRDMTRLYPVSSPTPLQQVTAGDVIEGGGFVFYSQQVK